MRKITSMGVTAFAALTMILSIVTLVNAAGAPTANRPAAKILRPKPLSVGAPPAYYFGGSTLPGTAYLGNGALTSNNPTPTARSFFGYFAANLAGSHSSSAQYCLTGSGFGKTVLVSGIGASLPCSSGPPVAGVNGFGAPTGDNIADAIGSDIPLAQSDYDAWAAASRTGELVQIPEVVGAIALVANEDNGPAVLRLSQATICKIYDGEITQWKDVPGYSSADTNTIRLVVRSDSSGTTFSFSNFLANVCGLRGGSPVARFSAESVLIPTALPSPLVSPLSLPTKDAVTSNASALAKVNSVNNSHELAYIEDSYMVDAPSAGITLQPDIRVAQIETNASGGGGTGLFAGPLSVTITASNIPSAAWTTDKVVSTGVNMLPGLVAIGSHAPSVLGCNIIADPTQYSTVTAAGSYPIISISYLEFASAGNGSQGATDLTQLAMLGIDASTTGKGISNNYAGLFGVNTIDKAGASPGSTGSSTLDRTTTSTLHGLITGTSVGANCIGS